MSASKRIVESNDLSKSLCTISKRKQETRMTGDYHTF